MTVIAPYNSYLVAMADGDIHFLTDDVTCALVTDSYAPNVTSQSMMSHITGEVATVSYERQLLAGKTRVYDPVIGKTRMSATSPLFPNLTASGVRYAVFFVDTGDDATSPLMFYWDFQTRYNPNGNDFRVVVNTSGLITLGPS